MVPNSKVWWAVVANSKICTCSFFFTDRVNLKTGVSKKQSTPNFPKNKHWTLCFLEYPFGDSLFCLITDELVFYSWSSQLLTWLFFSSLSFFLGLNFRFRIQDDLPGRERIGESFVPVPSFCRQFNIADNTL